MRMHYINFIRISGLSDDKTMSEDETRTSLYTAYFFDLWFEHVCAMQARHLLARRQRNIFQDLDVLGLCERYEAYLA